MAMKKHSQKKLFFLDKFISKNIKSKNTSLNCNNIKTKSFNCSFLLVFLFFSLIQQQMKAQNGGYDGTNNDFYIVNKDNTNVFSGYLLKYRFNNSNNSWKIYSGYDSNDLRFEFLTAGINDYYQSGTTSMNLNPSVLTLPYDLKINSRNATGSGLILSDDGSMVDNNNGYATMRFSNGVLITDGNNSNTAVIKLHKSGTIYASSLSIKDGNSSQFLKADGSLDSTTYLTTAAATNSYLPLSGGTLTGGITATSFVKSLGTASQFLKADGSVDSNTYLTTAAATNNYLPITGGDINGFIGSNTLRVYNYLPINTYGGAFLQWNRSGNEGETWLINQQGAGGDNAGIRFGKSSNNNVTTEFARFLNNGNFGINTTGPTEKLHVANGNVKIQNGKLIVGDYSAANTSVSIGGAVQIFPSNTVPTTFNSTYGTDYLLWVQKGIVTNDVAFAEITDWADDVFTTDYKLLPLDKVNEFVKDNGHLPNIPSEAEVKKDGYTVHTMTKKLLQKIEELTLYAIDQEAKLEEQSNKIEQLLKVVEQIQKK